jgi:hypothetical protein
MDGRLPHGLRERVEPPPGGFFGVAFAYSEIAMITRTVLER